MWYLSVFVPAAEIGQAAQIAAAVWPLDPDPAGNLSVSLADGTGAEWRGGNAALSDGEIAALQGLQSIDGVKWYRYAIDPPHALAASFPEGAMDGAAWGWEASLLDAGLSYPAEAA